MSTQVPLDAHPAPGHVRASPRAPGGCCAPSPAEPGAESVDVKAAGGVSARGGPQSIRRWTPQRTEAQRGWATRTEPSRRWTLAWGLPPNLRRSAFSCTPATDIHARESARVPSNARQASKPSRVVRQANCSYMIGDNPGVACCQVSGMLLCALKPHSCSPVMPRGVLYCGLHCPGLRRRHTARQPALHVGHYIREHGAAVQPG